MVTPSVRSTCTLDAETAQIIQRLAASWGVSRAEAVRRAIRIAVAQNEPGIPTPAEVVAHYRSHAVPRNWPETQNLVEKLRAQRGEDDVQRTAWCEG